MVLDGVCGIVQCCIVGGSFIKPSIIFPEISYVIIIPAELLSQWTRETVEALDILWIGIVISQHRKYGTVDV